MLGRSRVLPFGVAALVAACNENYEPAVTVEDDAGAAEPDAGGGDGDDAGVAPTFGGLTVDTTPSAQDIDPFDHPGHRFWVQVSPEQLARINETPQWVGPRGVDERPGGGDDAIGQPGGGGGEPGPGGEIYTPPQSATFADHLVVQDAVTNSVADYGKVEVKIVGSMTRRNFTASTIPSLRFDMDEFQDGLRLGDVEHFRLNNGLGGSIYRELVAYRIYRALGYPAIRTTYAFIGSNVWGDDVWIPMTLTEVYKLKFCKDNRELVGGDCVNMWEFPADINVGPLPANACQAGDCASQKVEQLAEAVAAAPRGAGFKEALEPFIDWTMFHKFQCLSWILGTWDDPIHAGNNNMIIERDDGKLVWAPFSVDLSAGAQNMPPTNIYGTTVVAKGCQADPQCWSDTVGVCREVVEAFDALNPETIVRDAYETLEKHHMLRDYDVERAQWLEDWYANRQEGLLEELELFSGMEGENGCPQDLSRCEDGSCGTEEQCAGRCSLGATWCATTERCTWSPEECPVCTEELPFYCSVSNACVESLDACSAACGEGQVYCQGQMACVPVDAPCGR